MAAFKSKDEMKKGMRVRCLFGKKGNHPRYGKIAILNEDVLPNPYIYYDVLWEDGCSYYLFWQSPDSFEPAEDKIIVKELPVQSHICPCGITRQDCDYHK